MIVAAVVATAAIAASAIILYVGYWIGGTKRERDVVRMSIALTEAFTHNDDAHNEALQVQYSKGYLDGRNDVQRDIDDAMAQAPQKDGLKPELKLFSKPECMFEGLPLLLLWPLQGSAPGCATMTIKHLARPEHEVAYDDLVLLIRKHSQKVSALELLAIAANMVGKLAALQDQRMVTPEKAMRVIADNLQFGNKTIIEKLTNEREGSA